MKHKLSVTLTKPEKVLGWIYLPLQLLVIPVALVFLNTLIGAPLGEAQINFVFFCLNFLLLTLIFHRYLIQSAKISLAHPWRTISSALLGYGGYMAGSYALSVIILLIEPEFFNVNDSSIAGIFISLVSSKKVAATAAAIAARRIAIAVTGLFFFTVMLLLSSICFSISVFIIQRSFS